MNKCDYCCIRPSSLEIVCLKCSPSRSIKVCVKCSINVSQLREHSKQHPLSTYKLNDIPLDNNRISEWLCNDEMNLIEAIETCGLGNWIDIAAKLSRNQFDCQTHFEDIYLSRLNNPYSIYFQSFRNTKQLIGENQINEKDFANQSIIYPPLLIDSEQQKTLTYMPQRDEYEREYLNEDENRLPILTNDQDFLEDIQQDGSRILLNKAKLVLLRSYKQTIQRRLQLKHFIRDYALGFNYAPDQPMDLHHISRFLSADQYERLIFNHRRIRSLLEELGCSTSSNNHHHDQPQPRKRSPILNSEKRRRRASSIVVDESSSCSSASTARSSSSSSSSATITSDATESNLSLSSSTNQTGEITDRKLLNGKRRSVRRVSSSSSTETSSKVANMKEPLYTRRRVNQSDQHSTSQRATRSAGNVLTTSDISWDSTDDEMGQLSTSQMEDEESTVASRTRSHTPPHPDSDRKQRRHSPHNKKYSNHTNGGTKFDPSDQSTPKTNRMLTRHQLVVQQTSPNKRRKLNSNSIDEQFYDV
ncbi:unnamed protein product [Adineta ricciae]|uniref:Myb-like domain-containing protein n=1 Tax=Adineta ricciae TaxID=249248 RepID=A0A815W5M0_ADIRI|nr:unnamed protein product [Adineta ricciae]